MAQSIDWEGTNFTLLPPSGVDETQCSTMRAFFNGACFVSCWEPSPAELEEIIRTGQVFASLWGHPPPLFIGSESAVHEVVADFGPVWKLRKDKVKAPTNHPLVIARLLRAIANSDNAITSEHSVIFMAAVEWLEAIKE